MSKKQLKDIETQLAIDRWQEELARHVAYLPVLCEQAGVDEQELHRAIEIHFYVRSMSKWGHAMSREAMKQPEALRLADVLDDEYTQGRISNHTGRKAAVELRRLALKQWVGLTDGEIDILSCEMVKGYKSVNWLCKVLEAKLKEKNHG